MPNPSDDDDEQPVSIDPAILAQQAGPPPGYAEYEIDIEAVLRSGLPERFRGLAEALLTAENVARLPARAKGGYMLTMGGRDVYAGKTDTRHGFRDRLGRHFNTVQHRRDLDPGRIGFKAVRIPVFSSFDAEAILIQEVRRGQPGALPWNDSGFGSNDPGHNREGQEPADFDKQHPIDIDIPLAVPSLNIGQAMSAHAALFGLKSHLPYLLRYQTDLKPNGKPAHPRVGHADQRASAVTLPPEPMTTRSILVAVLAGLPAGWVATRFPDRVILYKEPTAYPYALETMPRP